MNKYLYLNIQYDVLFIILFFTKWIILESIIYHLFQLYFSYEFLAG